MIRADAEIALEFEDGGVEPCEKNIDHALPFHDVVEIKDLRVTAPLLQTHLPPDIDDSSPVVGIAGRGGSTLDSISAVDASRVQRAMKSGIGEDDECLSCGVLSSFDTP